jgi:endonuclease/exonuclease/phosphatase family metal-dependent hydrolase
MPFYTPLKYGSRGFKPEERLRTAQNLLKLRKQLKSDIPPKTINDTLLLATWNLRNFTSGKRIEESFFYIAEIIAAFDIVALQEVGDNLQPMEEVMKILGSRYNFIVTDTTEGDEGHLERLGFVYDSRKVTFQDVAGEVVLPQEKLLEGERQFARSPFIAAFQARWFKFMLCNVHILYGQGKNEKKIASRKAEIKEIAEFVAARSQKVRKGKKKGYNYILLGDFNIISPTHETMQPLLDAGYEVLDELKKPTTIGGEKHYDQIVFKSQKDELKLGGGEIPGTRKRKAAGVFKYYDSVFNENDYKTYLGYYKKKVEGRTAEKKKEYFKRYWRTHQMSDHYLKWVELQIDFSDRYLEHRVAELKK